MLKYCLSQFWPKNMNSRITHTNNDETLFLTFCDHTMVFIYGCVTAKINDDQNTHQSLAVLIARYATSMQCVLPNGAHPGASLEATGCYHQACICAVYHRWPPWSLMLVQGQKSLANATFS
jgi:hypothetical protein